MKRFLAQSGVRPHHLQKPNLFIQRYIHLARGSRRHQPLFLPYSFSSPGVWRGHFLLVRAFSLNPEKDYYKILGVNEEATLAEVKSAYYKLAKKWHPDLFQQKPEAQLNEAREKFRAIQEAHEVLSDKDKRAQYDMQRKYGSTGRTMGGSGFGPSSGYNQGFNRGYSYQSQSQYGRQSQEDFWKRRQEMHQRMEEMRKQNPEMYEQQEQIRNFLSRLWLAMLIFLAVRLLFGISYREEGNPDQFINRVSIPHEQGEEDDFNRRYRDSRFGERPLGARRFRTPEQSSSRDRPTTFGGVSYPKKIYILGDELPSMYLSPATEMMDDRPSYRSSRPIAGTGLYFILYHGEGEWRISLSQYVNQGSKCYAKVEDSAYNPTDISSTWSVFDRRYNRYEHDTNFRVSSVPAETGEGQWT